jgi:hypothetical protein
MQTHNAGSAKKRRQWAEALAEYMAGDWAKLPTESNPFEIEGVEADLVIYADGDSVCVYNENTTKKIGALKKTSFRRRYFNAKK